MIVKPATAKPGQTKVKKNMFFVSSKYNNCFPLTSFFMPCAELAQNQYSTTDACTEYKTLAV